MDEMPRTAPSPQGPVTLPLDKAGQRDELIRRAEGRGWQLLRGCVDQDDTIRLLMVAARRTKLRIETCSWSMDGIVTFKVTSKVKVAK